MRLPQTRAHPLLLLLPALRVLASSIADVDTADTPLARAAVPAYADVSSLPDPSLAPVSPGSKGTKDAPVDGMDGKPHAGPYVDDTPRAHGKKPNVVEELGPGTTPVSSQKDSTILVGAEDSVLDGDKSVMQDPDRKLATGSTGTEGGVSAKDKERLAHEEKTGEKMEKVPESPKEAPPLPQEDQKKLGSELEVETTTRALGAVGLEVGRSVV